MDSQYITSKLEDYGVPYPDSNVLAAVGYGESGYNAGIVGDSGDSIGLFQINIPGHWDKLINWTGSEDRNTWVAWLSNPDNNIYAASEVYKSQGLGAWTIFNNGSYNQYLNDNFEVQGTTQSDAEETTQTVTSDKLSWKNFIPGLPEFQNPFTELKNRLTIPDYKATEKSQGLATNKAANSGAISATTNLFNPFSSANLKIIFIIIIGIMVFVTLMNIMKGGATDGTD